MEYMIYHKNLIEPEHQQDFFEQEVQKKIYLLEKVLSGYRKSLRAKLYVIKPSPSFYRISVSLPMRSRLLYLEEEGEKPVLIVNQLLDKLLTAAREQLKTERKEHLNKRKVRQEQNLKTLMPKLEQRYQEKEKEAFNHLLFQILPSLQEYVSRRLQMAKATSLLKSKTVQLEDLIGEAWIKIYERFPQKPANEKELLPWIYKITDEVIEGILQEKNFEKEHLKALEILTAEEYKSMREKFTAGADGELVMMEELEDPSYQIRYYEPEQVLEDRTEGEIIEKITQQYDVRAFHEELSKILAYQPSLHRSIFDLYWLEQFSVEEIAEIKSVTVEEAQKILEELSDMILTNLSDATEQSGKISS